MTSCMDQSICRGEYVDKLCGDRQQQVTVYLHIYTADDKSNIPLEFLLIPQGYLL